eukprot:scaffold2166_cov85-Skeletonema_dohrnii-CCMP3373.AAC.2
MPSRILAQFANEQRPDCLPILLDATLSLVVSGHVATLSRNIYSLSTKTQASLILDGVLQCTINNTDINNISSR